MLTNESHKEYPATILLDNGGQEMKNAQIIIKDLNSEVTVGVVAPYRVFNFNADGNLTVHLENCGDYRVIGKNSTVAEFFDALKEVEASVANMVEKAKSANNGEKA